MSGWRLSVFINLSCIRTCSLIVLEIESIANPAATKSRALQLANVLLVNIVYWQLTTHKLHNDYGQPNPLDNKLIKLYVHKQQQQYSH